MIAWIGGLLVIIAALMLYVAAPNQKLLASVSSRRPLAWSGVALLAGGLLLMEAWAGPATSVFIVMTIATLIWSVMPLGIAWWRAASGDGS